jgi:colanic acid biosynthesis glycosyl transferase WcaI
MKILIYGINFAPELTGIGKYTGEMAERLSAVGHQVHVVTALPYYPKWRVWEGYVWWRYRREYHLSFLPTQSNQSGDTVGYRTRIDVFRCPLWVPRKQSGLKRLLHLTSFALSSLPVMLGQIFWRPDVVFAVEPPLFCAPQAWLCGRLSGAKVWLHIQDFEVDAAFGLGLLPSFFRNVVGTLGRWLMRRFDRVSTISKCMCERLSNKGVDVAKQVFFPNWVDTQLIFPLEHTSPMRQELGIAPEAIVLLYSGNMGEKQGLEIVIACAQRLAGQRELVFVLCGDGAAYPRLRKMSVGLQNIFWLSLQPFDRLNDLLNLADIHLLPQRGDAADLVMPSKLTGMLASGRPVVATAVPGTQVAAVVETCGIVTKPENAEEFEKAILALAGSREMRVRLGSAAREYAVCNLGREEVLALFEQNLVNCVASM